MMEKLKEFRMPILLLLLAAALTWQWTHAHRQLESARRETEAAQLALKNQIVENQETRRQLQGSLEDLLKEKADLNAAFNQAMEAAPGAKPASVSRLDTGPLKVDDATRESHQARTTGAGAPEPGSTLVPAPVPPCPHCALSNGDTLSVEVAVIELQTEAENTVVIGTADVWREEPAPRIHLAGGSFKSSVSRSHELTSLAPAPPRWGFLALGACGALGCGPGAGVLFPPVTLPLVGWRAEAFLGAVAAPGAALFLGGLGVRW